MESVAIAKSAGPPRKEHRSRGVKTQQQADRPLTVSGIQNPQARSNPGYRHTRMQANHADQQESQGLTVIPFYDYCFLSVLQFGGQ
jgi:hypothetical protein